MGIDVYRESATTAAPIYGLSPALAAWLGRYGRWAAARGEPDADAPAGAWNEAVLCQCEMATLLAWRGERGDTSVPVERPARAEARMLAAWAAQYIRGLGRGDVLPPQRMRRAWRLWAHDGSRAGAVELGEGVMALVYGEHAPVDRDVAAREAIERVRDLVRYVRGGVAAHHVAVLARIPDIEAPRADRTDPVSRSFGHTRGVLVAAAAHACARAAAANSRAPELLLERRRGRVMRRAAALPLRRLGDEIPPAELAERRELGRTWRRIAHGDAWTHALEGALAELEELESARRTSPTDDAIGIVSELAGIPVGTLRRRATARAVT